MDGARGGGGGGGRGGGGGGGGDARGRDEDGGESASRRSRELPAIGSEKRTASTGGGGGYVSIGDWMSASSGKSGGASSAERPIAPLAAAAAGAFAGGAGWAPQVVVAVDGSETRDDGTGRHTAYAVSVRAGLRTWHVPQRYSEFHALGALLEAALPSTALPRCPPKKLIGSLSPEFVNERRAALDAYLRCARRRRRPRCGVCGCAPE